MGLLTRPLKGLSDFLLGILDKQTEHLLSQIEAIFPDLVLIALMVLIVLRFIGFEKTGKYIALTLIIAVLVALY